MSKRRGSFLLLGAFIGFIAGLFFAPKKGSELRKDAKNKIDEIKENPKEVLRGTIDDVKGKINHSSHRYLFNTHYVPITIQRKLGFQGVFKYI